MLSEEIAEARSFIMFDLERRPDDFARRISSRGGEASHVLWEVNCASLLRIVLDGQYKVESAYLETFHADQFDEPDILANVEDRLERAAPNSWLVTYDGTRHDVPVFRQRLVRWWLPQRRALLALAQSRHLDVARWMAGRAGKIGSLRDGCASVGVSMNPTEPMQAEPPPREMVKCEMDVTGTAVLAFYALADLLGRPDPLVNGLPSLRDALQDLARQRPHLGGIAANPVLARPAGPWGHLRAEVPWVISRPEIPSIARNALRAGRPGKGRRTTLH